VGPNTLERSEWGGYKEKRTRRSKRRKGVANTKKGGGGSKRETLVEEADVHPVRSKGAQTTVRSKGKMGGNNRTQKDVVLAAEGSQ